MTTPQTQAEAMAVEVVKEWRLTGNALVSCISTALTKLIAENERLKEAQRVTCSACRNCTKGFQPKHMRNGLCIDCVQSQLAATEAKLSEAQIQTNGFDIEIRWSWGRTCTFRETFKCWSQTDDKEEIKKHVLYVVEKIKRDYCFDCGDLAMPLNPSIDSVSITPALKAMHSKYIYDEDVTQNHLIKEHISTLAEKVNP